MNRESWKIPDRLGHAEADPVSAFLFGAYIDPGLTFQAITGSGGM